MRVLVCGGRDYNDTETVFSVLSSLVADKPVTAIIHGAAAGADKIAGGWARLSGIPEEPFAADWNEHGRAAGAIRNRRMLVEGKPDLVIAFPGGRGTENMVAQAMKAGVPVRRVL